MARERARTKRENSPYRRSRSLRCIDDAIYTDLLPLLLWFGLNVSGKTRKPMSPRWLHSDWGMSDHAITRRSWRQLLPDRLQSMLSGSAVCIGLPQWGGKVQGFGKLAGQRHFYLKCRALPHSYRLHLSLRTIVFLGIVASCDQYSCGNMS